MTYHTCVCSITCSAFSHVRVGDGFDSRKPQHHNKDVKVVPTAAMSDV